MARGSLRIYLGASPGVGKTYAMLNEGFRRAERGTDVVIGVVETHGRVSTAQVRNLEIVPRKQVEYRGTVLEEMDIDGILQRRPQVVLVDEYAHTNAPGSRHEKRWQDVEQLLDAGIDVISTLNIQHLDSLNDVVSRITGTVQRETVPDAIVRRADQVELVDMSPEAIRRRMAHGNIYPAERIDAALSNYFRLGNLGALRELALLWVANRVEESLSAYLADHGIMDAWETRERVLVGITGAPNGDVIIRRAARIAGRVGGDLIGVHIITDDGLRAEQGGLLAQQRKLVVELGGRVREVLGADRAEALVTCARVEKATQLVLGASRRSRWYEMWHGSFIAKVARLAQDIDVHVIGHEAESRDDEPARPASVRSTLDRRRLAAAWVLAIVGLPLLTAFTAPGRGTIRLETELLLYLSLVLFISLLGGRLVAAVAAIEASLLANWYFVEPIHTFTIAEPANILAIAVFFAVAITVGTLVDIAARRSSEGRRARIEAEALARAAATLAADPDPLPGLLEQIRLTFGFRSVHIDERVEGAWHLVARAGEDQTPTSDEAGEIHVVEITGGALGEGVDHRLAFVGRRPTADDQRVLRSLLDQLAVALEARRLASEAGEVELLTTMDAVRTALLRAVSHDLRTPLSSIKAMVSGLLDSSVQWTHVQITDALNVVDEETDRLNRLVGNLLDASRLQIGALAMTIDEVEVADVIANALHSVGSGADRVVVEVEPDVPAALADGALLERSLANIIGNALRHSGDSPPRVSVARVGRHVHLCVIDRGPGIPVEARSRVMEPFQRFGDEQGAAEGVGLGMSIAQGFVHAMGGELSLDDTPGGGLTVTIVLPTAADPSLRHPERAT